MTDGVALGEVEGVTEGVALGEVEGVTDGVTVGVAEEVGGVVELAGADGSGRVLGSSCASVGLTATGTGSPASGVWSDPSKNTKALINAPNASPPIEISHRRRRLAGLERASSSRLRLLRGRLSSFALESCG